MVGYCIQGLWHVSVIREEFCDDLEMKFISVLGGIQQIRASETTAKSVTPCFGFG